MSTSAGLTGTYRFTARWDAYPDSIREKYAVTPDPERPTIFEALPAPVLLGDMDGNLLDTNLAGSMLTGHNASTIRGLTVLDVVAARPEWTVSEFGRFGRDGFWRGELDCRRADGSTSTPSASPSSRRASGTSPSG